MPSPETGPVFALFPPLMKMPSGPRPPPPPAASPLAPLPAEVPPGAPGCGPSGEIEMRAERFPAGIAGGGATGAGVAERAIKVPAIAGVPRQYRAQRHSFHLLRGRAWRRHRADRQDRLRRRLRGRSDVDDACSLLRRGNFRRGGITDRERRGSLGPHGRQLLAVSCKFGAPAGNLRVARYWEAPAKS